MPAPTEKSALKRSHRIKLALLVGLVIVPALAFLLVVELWADFPQQAIVADRLIDELKSAGYPTKLSEINPPIKPGDVNGIPYLEAAKEVDPDRIFSQWLFSPVLPFGDEFFDQILRDYSTRMEYLELAADADHWIPPNSEVELFGVFTMSFAVAKKGVQSFVERAGDRARKGDKAGALADIERALKMSNLVDDQPFVMNTLNGAAYNALINVRAQELAYLWREDPERVKQLRQILIKHKPHRSFRKMIQAEWLYVLASGTYELPVYNVLGVEILSRPGGLKANGLPANLTSRGFLGPALRFYKEWDAWLLSDASDIEKVQKGVEIRDRISSSKKLTNLIIDNLFLVNENLGIALTKETMSRQLLLAHLDIVIYQAAKSPLPTDKELQKILPKDRFGGKSTLFARTAGGFRVWSVGPSDSDRKKNDPPLEFAFPPSTVSAE